MRFYLVLVTTRGYTVREDMDVESLQEAAHRHVDAYLGLRSASALVLRDQKGKRYCTADSMRIIKDSK